MASVRVGPPPRGLAATLGVPGDKSIAHRALLLGALAEGTTTVSGFPGGGDVLSSLGAMRALGEFRAALDRLERLVSARDAAGLAAALAAARALRGRLGGEE